MGEVKGGEGRTSAGEKRGENMTKRKSMATQERIKAAAMVRWASAWEAALAGDESTLFWWLKTPVERLR